MVDRITVSIALLSFVSMYIAVIGILWTRMIGMVAGHAANALVGFVALYLYQNVGAELYVILYAISSTAAALMAVSYLMLKRGCFNP